MLNVELLFGENGPSVLASAQRKNPDVKILASQPMHTLSFSKKVLLDKHAKSDF